MDSGSAPVTRVGKPVRRALLFLGFAIIFTLLSSTKEGAVWATYSEIMGCEFGCRVAAAGWPVPYIADYPGISVVGSADVVGAGRRGSFPGAAILPRLAHLAGNYRARRGLVAPAEGR